MKKEQTIYIVVQFLWPNIFKSSRILNMSTTVACFKTDDKDDNDMVLGAVHKSSGIYLTTELKIENLR